MQRRRGRSWERLVAAAGSGVGVETTEVSRWTESHRTRRSGWIVTANEAGMSIHPSNMALSMTSDGRT